MRLMPDDVVEWLKEIAGRSNSNDEHWAETYLAMEILERMNISYPSPSND